MEVGHFLLYVSIWHCVLYPFRRLFTWVSDTFSHMLVALLCWILRNLLCISGVISLQVSRFLFLCCYLFSLALFIQGYPPDSIWICISVFIVTVFHVLSLYLETLKAENLDKVRDLLVCLLYMALLFPDISWLRKLLFHIYIFSFCLCIMLLLLL